MEAQSPIFEGLFTYIRQVKQSNCLNNIGTHRPGYRTRPQTPQSTNNISSMYIYQKGFRRRASNTTGVATQKCSMVTTCFKGDMYLHSAISSPRPPTLHSVHHLPTPVLQDIWHIPDSISMGQKVPTSSTVSVVVEPRAKDEIGCCGQKDT